MTQRTRGWRPSTGTAAILTLLLTTACSAAPASEPSGAPGAADSTSASRDLSVAGRVRGEIETLLRARARAVRTGDLAAFSKTTSARGNRAEQVAWFRHLQALPVAKVAYRLGNHDASVSDKDMFRAEAEVLIQLDGFDRKPVPTVHSFTFRRTGSGWRVRTEHWDPSQVSFAPWEMKGSVAAVGDHVILFFDGKSARYADAISPVAEAALDYVAAEVPYDDWAKSAVVLMPSTVKDFEYEGFDPREIAQVGGVAYPYPGPDQHTIGSRVLVASTQLDADPEQLGILLRHEFTHVAIGSHDDAAPVWLREGLASYIGYERNRYVFTAALREQFPEGGVTQMPPDGLFHAGDWGPSYLLAWYSVLWLVANRSPDAPWDYLATLEKKPGDFRYESRVLDKAVGVTTDQLARNAGDLLLASIH